VIPQRPPAGGKGKTALFLAAALAAWVALYLGLEPAASWLALSLLGLTEGSHLASAAEFFLADAPKVLLLLVLVVFAMGVLRSFVSPDLARRALSGRRAGAGNLAAALLGVATPFCTCSAVPLFIGFLSAGVPLGVAVSFLVSAPMVNEVGLVLLWNLFGWKVALLYLVTGLAVAVAAGWAIGRLRMERHLEEWVTKAPAAAPAGAGPLSWTGRVRAGRAALADIVGRVWLFILAAVALGAWIHGYVPQELLVSFMGKGEWWSVPLAVLIGVPLYSGCAGIVPVVQALLGKGAALGTTLAFMMAVVGLSLPEAVILRRVMKMPLLLTFFGVVAAGILLVGYLFNLVY
jgi:uncharacterized membrane protein YraQ (UPF0718 family)